MGKRGTLDVLANFATIVWLAIALILPLVNDLLGIELSGDNYIEQVALILLVTFVSVFGFGFMSYSIFSFVKWIVLEGIPDAFRECKYFIEDFLYSKNKPKFIALKFLSLVKGILLLLLLGVLGLFYEFFLSLFAGNSIP